MYTNIDSKVNTYLSLLSENMDSKSIKAFKIHYIVYLIITANIYCLVMDMLTTCFFPDFL